MLSGNAAYPERSAPLSAAGLQLVTIFSGANSVARFSCGTHTAAGGARDGASAVALAKALGQPAGTAIYLDLQANQTALPAVWLRYIQTWGATVTDGGYWPAVYASPAQLEVIHGHPWAGSSLFYWAARQLAAHPLSPPPCPDTVLAFANLLQYTLQVEFCGVGGMNGDSAISTAGVWRYPTAGGKPSARPTAGTVPPGPPA